MCEKYSGWPNYPTWRTYTWLTDDGDAWIYEMVEESDNYSEFVADMMNVCESDGAGEAMGRDGDNLFSDLTGWLWEKIDWNYIADKFWDNKEKADVQGV